MVTRLRGVNLGGWLVLEKWMTPTLFAGTSAVDEYTFLQTTHAVKKLRHHHQTFIQEEDFAWMADNGVNAVRIPVGYWILDGDAPYASAIERLDWAFRMATKYQIEVLISLHGAPGSQNGADHSGRVGAANWYTDKALRMQTITILERLAARYKHQRYFWGIELLNEPKAGIFQWKLRQFYHDAYQSLSRIVAPSTRIVFHDAFTPRLMSGAIRQDGPPTVLDIHWYHFAFLAHRFVPLVLYWRLIWWHGRLIRRLSRRQPVIIGEWSNMLAQDTLDRVPVANHDQLLKEHTERQLTAYRQAAGWFYWTYKTERRGAWNFRSLVEDGLMPSDWQDQ